MTEQFKFLDCYAPMFYENKTYWLIYGGRGSGKSTNVAAYFVMKLMAPEYFRGVIARFTQRSLTNSIYRDIVDLIVNWNLSPYIELRNDEIRNKLNRNMIITHAFKIGDNTQTAKGKGIANPTHLLIDEAQEVPGEEEYLKLIDSFRTKGAERKIFVVFNPTTKSSWLFKRWFLPDGSANPKWAENHGFIYTTYKNNSHNLDPVKVKEWDLSALTDPEYYHHHILGNWRDVGAGSVFKNWSFSKFDPDPEAEVIYGLDFGFVDPTALVKISKKDRRIWIQELIYQSGLTPNDLSARMEALGISKNSSIYADSASPMAIEELQRLGWRNLRKANKGPDSISTGISKIHQYQAFADHESKNLIEEYYNYAYREGTDKPIDKYNHLMDALRYAVMALQDGPKYATIGRARHRAVEDLF